MTFSESIHLNRRYGGYVRRADDLIVLRNGKKSNSVSIEKAIKGHPWVMGALLAGANRLRTSFLLEPSDRVTVGAGEFLEEVWGCIEKPCFDVMNPQPCPWRELATVVQRYFGERALTPAGVELGEWLGELRAFDKQRQWKRPTIIQHYGYSTSQETESEGKKGGWAFATERGRQRSVAMTALGRVDTSLIQTAR